MYSFLKALMNRFRFIVYIYLFTRKSTKPTPGVLLNSVGVSTSTNPEGNIKSVINYYTITHQHKLRSRERGFSSVSYRARCKGTLSFSSQAAIAVSDCTAFGTSGGRDSDTASGELLISAPTKHTQVLERDVR